MANLTDIPRPNWKPIVLYEGEDGQLLAKVPEAGILEEIEYKSTQNIVIESVRPNWPPYNILTPVETGLRDVSFSSITRDLRPAPPIRLGASELRYTFSPGNHNLEGALCYFPDNAGEGDRISQYTEDDILFEFVWNGWRWIS